MTFGPILIAQNTPADALVLLRAFKSLGIANSARILTDGNQAIQYLNGEGNYSDREAHPRPALLFLDLRMPIPGIEVLLWQQAQGPEMQVPTIVVTDSLNVAEIRAAYGAGATSFLMKPITDEDLKNVLTWARGVALHATESGVFIGPDRQHMRRESIPVFRPEPVLP